MRAELAKARSRSKVMTALAVSLGTILVIIAGVGYVVYTKISAAKENFEEVFRAMPMPQGGAEQQNRMLAGQGVYSSTSLPVSSLGLFAGGMPQQLPANMDPEAAARVSQAVNKYLERPVMKEFIAELKTDPAIADALAKAKGGNPAALFVSLQNAKGIEKMMAKYVARPDFMKTLTDMSSDPALKGMAGGMGAAAMPSMPQQGQGAMPTVAIPQGQAQPGDSDGDGEMTFDPSAISGTPQAAPAPQQTASPKTKRVPSPVDGR